jgi:hypothetical protein
VEEKVAAQRLDADATGFFNRSNLGYMDAGSYTSRGEAARWNSNNKLGE